MQDRLRRRVSAAIDRASNRYCRRFVLKSKDGGSTLLEFAGVKRDVPTSDLPRGPGDFLAGALGSGVTQRRCELVVSRETWTEISRRDFKNSLVDELDLLGGIMTRWRPDASIPFDENTPDGSSVRLYLYEVKL